MKLLSIIVLFALCEIGYCWWTAAAQPIILSIGALFAALDLDVQPMLDAQPIRWQNLFSVQNTKEKVRKKSRGKSKAKSEESEEKFETETYEGKRKHWDEHNDVPNMPERKPWDQIDENEVPDRARKDWENFVVKEDEKTIKAREDMAYSWSDDMKRDAIEIGELYEKNEEEFKDNKKAAVEKEWTEKKGKKGSSIIAKAKELFGLDKEEKEVVETELDEVMDKEAKEVIDKEAKEVIDTEAKEAIETEA